MKENQEIANEKNLENKKQKKSARLRKKYHAIWNEIRYQKIDEIEKMTNEVIAVFERHHQDGRFMVTPDYLHVCAIFKRMRMCSMSYMAKDASTLIGLISPKFKKARLNKKDILKVKYIGTSSSELTHGKIYKSRKFTDSTYDLLSDNLGKRKIACCSDFEIFTKSC